MQYNWSNTDVDGERGNRVYYTETDAVKMVGDWKEESEGRTSEWENKQDKWHRLRMRIKKNKSFPFKGCSNIRMPTLDTKIRKQKASLLNVVFGIRPVVQVVPEDAYGEQQTQVPWEAARKVEKFLDKCIMEKINMRNKGNIIIDRSLEKGFYVVKPYFRYESITRVEFFNVKDLTMEEAGMLFSAPTIDMMKMVIADIIDIDTHESVRINNMKAIDKILIGLLEGKDNIRYEIKDVTYNAPDVAFCQPERLYVPTTAGYDPQSCEYIIHEFFLPYTQVQYNVETKGWDIDGLRRIEDFRATNLDDKQLDVTKETREGIQRLQSTTQQLVRIYECYCWYDINGDGVKEKCIITTAPDFGAELRKVTLPYHSGKFPFVKFFYELTDDRWFSHRGIPEVCEDIVKEIDIQHMQKIDYGTLANSPMFLYRAGMVSEDTNQFIFGQGIPVGGMNAMDDVFKPVHLQNPNIPISYEREEMILETKLEELIGQPDYSLQSMINRREPRTLGEVSLQQQNMQTTFQMDSGLYTEQFTELFNWIWELLVQYGDDEYIFNYTLPNGQIENLRLTREEIQGNYKIRVRGNDTNTNPIVRQQKSQFILSDTYQALQMGLVSPVAAQNARKRAFENIDVEDYEEFMIPPEPTPPPPTENIKLDGDDLTPLEIAQLVKQNGIQPDMRGRGEEIMQENRDKKFEQLTEVAKLQK